MLANSKVSLAGNLLKSFSRLMKNTIIEYLNSPTEIKRETKIWFTPEKLAAYAKIMQWNDSSIHPVFPYALITHIQFSMVNDKYFPFSPYGIVHKKEEIECIKPLVKGDWVVNSYLDSISKVDNGFELISITELRINGELYWTSKTTAYKKTKSGASKIRPNKEKLDSDVHWYIPEGLGRTYGMISNNVDPIHMSKQTAKLMGFKKGAIMHGMWTVARGVSDYSKIEYPFKIAAKFIAPIYMPAKVSYLEAENGFGVYSKDGKRVHLLVEVIKD